VSKSSANERGWILGDGGVDNIMMLEDLAASVINGQVKGRGAILASLTHMTAIHKGRNKRKL
jgi:hypothetical protein